MINSHVGEDKIDPASYRTVEITLNPVQFRTYNRHQCYGSCEQMKTPAYFQKRNNRTILQTTACEHSEKNSHNKANITATLLWFGFQ